MLRTAGKPIAILFGVLAVVAAVFAARIVWIGGVFRSIEPHFAGRCHLVEGPVGPEDLTIHPRTGVAYISASDRRAVFGGKPVPGAIFAYDLNAADPHPVNLTPNADIAFQPHGLSLWVGDDGREVLERRGPNRRGQRGGGARPASADRPDLRRQRILDCVME